jgi:pyrroline-5-carboxylate reductase
MSKDKGKDGKGVMFEDFTVAFIGSGTMAEAIISGLLRGKVVDAAHILAAEPREERGAELHKRYNIRWTADNTEAARAADLVVLAIKPQVLEKVVPDIQGQIKPTAMVLSILAGVTIDQIAEATRTHRVVRAMPNTPAQIGQGITVWTATREVQEAQVAQAKAVLAALGEEVYVDSEDYLDMATALSGTGPAYVFMFMESMIDAGVHLGFSRRVAEQLVYQTIRGSVEFAAKSGKHQAELRNQVTSPGGTSAEAIYQLEKGGMRTVLSRAIWAAYQRSVALGSGGKVSRLGGRDPEDLADGR